MQEIDQRDRELLGALQGEIPLVSTPFAVLGQQIEMSEKEVIKRTERLKHEGLVRQLGAQFDLHALGYRSCLVAARVQPEKIDDAAAIVSAHPGVSQNYRRNHDFNLWFTIAVGPESKLGLEKTIDLLGAEADCDTVRQLPTLKQYKSASSDGGEPHSEAEPTHPEFTPLTPSEVEVVRLLQRDLPLQPRPFEALSRSAGLGGDEILGAAKSLQRRGQMRRFGAVLQLRKPGFSASTMAVWSAPPERADELGEQLAQNRAVSHCYLRPVYEDWPYNLYTVVHGRSVDECDSIVNDLAIDTGITKNLALYPTREYKKTRIVLFSSEAEEWESQRAGSQTAAAS
jgi:DNA-binding Lrp family transcriptional regulator